MTHKKTTRQKSIQLKSTQSSSPKKIPQDTGQSGQLVQIIDRYQTHQQDTGSPEVQVAILTQRILKLADHLKIHNKDYDSKRGLLMLVGKRRRLLNYITRHSQEKYQQLIADLGLRK